MPELCQICLLILFLFSFLWTLVASVEGWASSPGNGAAGAVTTVVAYMTLAALMYGAGLFSFMCK